MVSAGVVDEIGYAKDVAVVDAEGEAAFLGPY
jgi:hypothetical protein